MTVSRPQVFRVPVRVVFTGCILLTLMAAILRASTVTPPGGECEARFMQELFTCFHRFDVPFNSYLWAVGNGTGGVAPDNQTVFRQHMCSVEKDVVQCVLDSLHALVDTVDCHTAQGMEALLTVQVRAIFEEYDNHCAHDCRLTLEGSMKQCYEDLQLDSSLFMSTSSDGAILGRSPSSVTQFCNNSDALVTCLKKEKDACPEAPYVLRRLGLDLDTLTTGLDILCSQPNVYLSSLDCFGHQTREVEKCQEDHALSLMRMVSKAKVAKRDVTGSEFLNRFCLARLQYIKCDLLAWAAKPEDACDAPALALKRDVHCGQVPAECLELMPGPMDKLCTYNWAAATLTAPGDQQGHTSGARAGARRARGWVDGGGGGGGSFSVVLVLVAVVGLVVG